MGDLSAAKRWLDDSVSMMTGWHLAKALTTRAWAAIAQGELDQAERDAQQALTLAAEFDAYQVTRSRSGSRHGSSCVCNHATA
jgi:hypothetical protein